jgi:hypothetical protein
MKRLLLIAFAAAVGFKTEAQTYAPIILSGFSADVVAEGPGSAATSTTDGVDGVSFAFMAANFVNPSGQSPTSALPTNGTINSAATTGLTFQLAPYNVNNSLRISTPGSGTLTFSNPRTADQIYVLATSGSGVSTTTITVTFTDGTTQVFNQSIADWYGGTSFAIRGIGRVNRTNNGIENSTTDPRLYQYLLTLNGANTVKSIQSITFNKTSTTGVLNVMGVTIRSVASQLPNDVGVTAITTPNSSCSLTNQETVTVTVTNFGSAVQSNIPVSYTINGGTPATETLSGTLAPNTTTNYTFTTKANLSTNGTYALVASTGLPGDALTTNDSFSKTVTMSSAPVTPTVTASGPTTFCPGSTVTLTASTPTSGASFQWFLNGNAISGATSGVYAANVAGSYTAMANSNGCSSGTSTAVILSTAAAPATPNISASGPLIICTGGSVTLTATSTTTGATFTWLKNGSTISGANGASYTVTNAGSYSAMAISGGCTSTNSSATTVTVNTKPVTPTITQNGAKLISSSGVGNQWYLNNTLITGATSQTFTATTNGSYTVIVTNNSCSSSASNAVNMIAAGLEDEKIIAGVSVYPNPSNGVFNLIVPQGQVYEATVTDLTGKVLFTRTVKEANTKLNLKNTAKGIYVLKLVSNGKTIVRKIAVE